MNLADCFSSLLFRTATRNTHANLRTTCLPRPAAATSFFRTRRFETAICSFVRDPFQILGEFRMGCRASIEFNPADSCLFGNNAWIISVAVQTNAQGYASTSTFRSQMVFGNFRNRSIAKRASVSEIIHVGSQPKTKIPTTIDRVIVPSLQPVFRMPSRVSI